MTDRAVGEQGGRLWEIALGTLLLAVLLVAFRPLTPIGYDETLFTLSVADWNPRAHQPPPPGYPLLIGVAGLLAPLVSSPFAALVAMSIAGSLLAFVALARAFGRLAGSPSAGVAGALFLFLSPALLVHAPTGLSEPPALAFLAVALLWSFRLAERRDDHPLPDLLIFGAAAAGAIGFRPQFALATIPLVLYVVARVGPLKARLMVLAAFAAVCLLALAPLVAAVGGFGRLLAWAREGALFSSQGGLGEGALRLAARYLAHPWGMKWLAIPILLLALAGGTRLLLRRERLLVPVLLMGVPYLLVALPAAAPADAARVAIPFSIVVAALAGAGAGLLVPMWRAALASVVALVWGAFAFAYVRPILEVRRTLPSPPVSAARWAASNLADDAIVIVQPSLVPHARLLLGSFRAGPANEALATAAREARTPAWMFVEGHSPRRDAAKFWWPASDAWGKIADGRYRAVSVVPVPAAERFVPLEGIGPLEAAPDGTVWRWLTEEASLVVPPPGGSLTEFRFLLPADAPHEEVLLSLYIDGTMRAGLPVARGNESTARLQMPGGGLLTVVADRTYVPAEHGGRDRRNLAVMLLGVRQIP